MKESNIDLTTLNVRGKVETNLVGEAFHVWTTNSITSVAFNLVGDSYKRHSIRLPDKYHIPFRLDMTIMLDFPALILLVGDGHIAFASSDNHKIEDIVKPSGKPNQDNCAFDNKFPFGEFVDITVIWNLDEMQILIGGEERFYSCKLPYMKAKNLNELNLEGFEIGLAVSKLSTLSIKSITVTEFDGKAPVIRGILKELPLQKMIAESPKPTFENIILDLPQEYRNELIEMDNFLKSLKLLKFKRTIDKRSKKITYVASDFGISYVMQVSEDRLSHNFSWYIVSSGKPETWHRKADYMGETLTEIAKSDILLAKRIFYALNDCVNCYGTRCLAKTLYEFNGQKRLTCHGRVMLRMCHEDFQDAREFFRHLTALIDRKTADGSLQTEKIFCCSSLSNE
jgi:hypothetical protein